MRNAACQCLDRRTRARRGTGISWRHGSGRSAQSAVFSDSGCHSFVPSTRPNALHQRVLGLERTDDGWVTVTPAVTVQLDVRHGFGRTGLVALAVDHRAIRMILAALLAGLAAWLAIPSPAAMLRKPVKSPSGWYLDLWGRRPGARKKLVADRRLWTTRFASELAAELRAGQHPQLAWRQVWGCGPPQSSHLQASLLANVMSETDVMRAASSIAGCAGLGSIVACWLITERTGAGLARSLERVAGSLNADVELASEIDGQLVGPRATARLLVFLPVFALMLGGSLGARPLDVLLHSAPGWICLLAGSVLLAVGWRWSQLQVNTVLAWAGRP